MTLLSLLGLPVLAAVTCDSGARHPDLQSAVEDLECASVRLDAGTHFEKVTVGRNLTIAGAGRDETILFCVGGPCIHTTHGADVVVVAGLSVASTEVALESWGGRLMLVDARVTPLGVKGGGIRLRDTEAQFVDVEVEVSDLPAIDALAGSRSTLDFERVHFSGLGHAGSVRHVVYANSYGVSCGGCTFDRDRSFVVPGLLWGDTSDDAEVDGRSRHSLYPERSCPPPNPDARRVCEARCAGEEVALCDMTYRVGFDTCFPEATCVPEGEVPL